MRIVSSMKMMVPGATVFALLVMTAGFMSNPGAPRAGESATTAAPQSQFRFRRPVALVLLERDSLLFAANRKSGSISVIDTAANKPVAEYAVGEMLSDLVVVPGERFLVATDEARHQLILLERNGREVRAVGRLDVPAYPVTVRVSDDGSRCFVASLWSRHLTVIDLVRNKDAAQPFTAKVARSLPLSFAPRMQLWIPKARRLVVADSFSEKFAVIDPEKDRPESVRLLPAHNVRGLLLGADGKTLLVSHQILNHLARTNNTDVHWGILITNILRILSLDAVLNPQGDLLKGSHSVMMGDVGRAGADPGAIALAPEGRYVVSVSGVGGVTVAQPDKAIQYRVPAGHRPTALVPLGDGSRVYVADTLGDAVHLLDVVEGESKAVISLGPQPELTAVERGELLFHDARLSHDGWMSCHSCHTDGHTNHQLNDNLSDGGFDAPKRVLSLLGTADTAPWSWNGSAADLAAQVRKSATVTMQGRDLSNDKVDDLVAYMRSLAPPPALGLVSGNRDKVSIERGRAVFERERCHRCHAPPSYTTTATYDVGLKDELGQSKFNPPALRGVSQRDALFHDNRAGSLEDVVRKFRHQLRDELSDDDASALLAFLRSL